MLIGESDIVLVEVPDFSHGRRKKWLSVLGGDMSTRSRLIRYIVRFMMNYSTRRMKLRRTFVLIIDACALVLFNLITLRNPVFWKLSHVPSVSYWLPFSELCRLEVCPYTLAAETMNSAQTHSLRTHSQGPLNDAIQMGWLAISVINSISSLNL